MSIYRKIRKIIREKFKKPSVLYGVVSSLSRNKVERSQVFVDEYRSKGIYGVVDVIENHARNVPKLSKAKLYLEASMSIRSIQQEEDALLFARMAFDMDQSEPIRRGYAWAALRAQRYEAALEQVLELKKIYVDNPNELAEVSTNKIHASVINKLDKAIVLKLEKSKNTTKDKKNLETLKGLVFPKLKEVEALHKVLAAIYMGNGYVGLVYAIKNSAENDDRVKASLFLSAAKWILHEGDHKLNTALASEALKLDSSEPILRGAYWAYKHGGDRFLCKEMLDKIQNILNEHPNPKMQINYDKLYRNYDSSYGGLALIDAIPDSVAEPDYMPIKGKVAYVLHNSFPYSSGGYATRGHGLVTALKAVGANIQVVNRPGFPFDIKEELDEKTVPKVEIVDDIEYIKIQRPWRKGKTTSEYIREAAKALTAEFKLLKPSIVIGASNFLTAMPALIAARTLGIPFIYEVRGFWEITRLSREPSYEFHPAFTLQKTLESALVQKADHVFTLTQPMKEELIARGADSNKITLLPNSCDPSKFLPRAKDERLLSKLSIPKGVPVIGYIGTFVVYEGLEDLAAACGLLKEKGFEFRLLIVGNENASGLDRGPITQQIIDSASKYNFSEWLILPGRVPYEEVEAYYSLIDIAPFPRKPWPVCEMVSPMKPLEALAMKKAVVVSSVKALVEMIQDNQTGLVFKKGDVIDLANTLEKLMKDPELRVRLGERGRVWVEAERTWEITASKAMPIISKIGTFSKGDLC